MFKLFKKKKNKDRRNTIANPERVADLPTSGNSNGNSAIPNPSTSLICNHFWCEIPGQYCCACNDKRPYAQLYDVYHETLGWTQSPNRTFGYCKGCKLPIAPSLPATVSGAIPPPPSSRIPLLQQQQNVSTTTTTTTTTNNSQRQSIQLNRSMPASNPNVSQNLLTTHSLSVSQPNLSRTSSQTNSQSLSVSQQILPRSSVQLNRLIPHPSQVQNPQTQQQQQLPPRPRSMTTITTEHHQQPSFPIPTRNLAPPPPPPPPSQQTQSFSSAESHAIQELSGMGFPPATIERTIIRLRPQVRQSEMTGSMWVNHVLEDLTAGPSQQPVSISRVPSANASARYHPVPPYSAPTSPVTATSSSQDILTAFHLNIKIPQHQHELLLLSGNQLAALRHGQYVGGNFRCDVCSQSGTGWVYHCGQCNFDAHLSCAKANAPSRNSLPPIIKTSQAELNDYMNVNNKQTPKVAPELIEKLKLSETTDPSTTTTTTTTETKDDDLCRVCWDRKIDCVLIPCGHLSFCYACAVETNSKSRQCAICRATIVQIVRTFKA